MRRSNSPETLAGGSLHAVVGRPVECENRCLTMRTSTHIVSAYEKPKINRHLPSVTIWPHVSVRRWHYVEPPRGCCRALGNAVPRSSGRELDCKHTGTRTGRNRHPMNKCPKCGHTWPDTKRASGGKARWRGLTKKQRSQAASAAAKARWARTPNNQAQ